MKKASKIYIAGHTGMVGSALIRILKEKGYHNFVCFTHEELDLTNQARVNDMFKQHKPEYVLIGAAKVGGIQANHMYPADFLYENLLINANIIKAAHENQVKKLIALGSSCIYPKLSTQPIPEEELLTGALEPTNEGYAIAKIAAIELCKFFKTQYGDNFISCMPTNLYGPNDNFDLSNSHVLPAAIHKVHMAKIHNDSEVVIWGSGNPLREFLYVDDMADACIYLMEQYDGVSHINIGSGEEISIKELYKTVARVIGYQGALSFDTTKPDGTPRKLVDSKRLHDLGWKRRYSLEQGIQLTYDWYLKHIFTNNGGGH